MICAVRREYRWAQKLENGTTTVSLEMVKHGHAKLPEKWSTRNTENLADELIMSFFTAARSEYDWHNVDWKALDDACAVP